MLQVLPLYPRLHPPVRHVPCAESHGWLKQWQVLEQPSPNVPGTHATKIHGYVMYIDYSK